MYDRNPSHYAERHGRTWPKARGADSARVVVVGGGLAGLATTQALLERGVRDVVVLEAGEIGRGASGRNGGFVFGGYSLGESALLRRLGPEAARRAYRWTVEAVRGIRKRVTELAIEADLCDGVVFANWFADPTPLKRRQRVLAEHYGVDWRWLDRAALARHVRSPRYSAGLYEPGAFHFDPLAYLRGLASHQFGQGVRVHEQSPVCALARSGAGWRIRTPGAEFDAEHVVLAGGAELPILAGVPELRRVAAARLPIATYALVTEPLGALARELLPSGAAIYDSRFAFDYYRRLPDERLLWGGRISIFDPPPARVAELLRADIARVFPELADVRIARAWSGKMSYARHQMPQVGLLDDGLWVAQAFGGHGLATTEVAGQLIGAAIAEGDLAYRTLAVFGLPPVHGWLGLLAAEATYRWKIGLDACRECFDPAG